MTTFSETIHDWQGFIKMVRNNAEKDDPNIIKLKIFLNVLENFKLSLNEKEKEVLLQSFVANSDRDNVLINISRLYSIKLTKKMVKMYNKVDMYEEQDNPDLVDNSGYFGIFYREKVNLQNITDE